MSAPKRACAEWQGHTRAWAARSSLGPPSAHVGEHHRGPCDQDCQTPAAYAQIDDYGAVPPASVQGGVLRVWRQHRCGLGPRRGWHVRGWAKAAWRLHILPRWYVWQRQGQRRAPGRWVWVLRWAAAVRHVAEQQQHTSQEQRNGRRSSTPATRHRASKHGLGTKTAQSACLLCRCTKLDTGRHLCRLRRLTLSGLRRCATGRWCQGLGAALMCSRQLHPRKMPSTCALGCQASALCLRTATPTAGSMTIESSLRTELLYLLGRGPARKLAFSHGEPASSKLEGAHLHLHVHTLTSTLCRHG
jgi:hypothetical protein